MPPRRPSRRSAVEHTGTRTVEEDDQSVYRLAHRTFAEHLTQEPATSRHWHADIVRRAIKEIEANENPNPYWLRHTSAHCADAGQDACEAVSRSAALDQLRPRAVSAGAMRSLFGRGPYLRDYCDHRQRSPTRYGSASRPMGHQAGVSRPPSRDLVAARRRHSATWSVAWDALARRPLHAVLTGHTGSVSAMAAVPLPDGRSLLATRQQRWHGAAVGPGHRRGPRGPWADVGVIRSLRCTGGRSCRARRSGPAGVRLISDQHASLVAALSRCSKGLGTRLCWAISGPLSTAKAGRLRYPPCRRHTGHVFSLETRLDAA